VPHGVVVGWHREGLAARRNKAREEAAAETDGSEPCGMGFRIRIAGRDQRNKKAID
jgi:hypothetical protein